MQPRWIEIQGKVLAQPGARPWSSREDDPCLVTSPGLGSSCLLYRIELTALQRLLEASSRPFRERAGRRFVLQTTEGHRWSVDPSSARLCWSALPLSLGIGRSTEQDERLLRLYQRLGRTLRRRVVRLREWRIVVGDRLRVSAWLQRAPSPDGEPAGYRQPPTLPLLTAVALFRSFECRE